VKPNINKAAVEAAFGKPTEIPHYNIVFATPGNSFVPGYVKSLLMTIHALEGDGISWFFLNAGGSHVGVTRERTISGDNFYANNKITVPHNGEFTYDKMMWIDSDISWSVQDISKMYYSDKDIISGAYMMADRVVVMSKNPWGQMMPEHEFVTFTEPFSVASIGFGFVCIKQGVFESLAKPWFGNPDDNDKFLIGEDIAWCFKARKAGYEIWVDPSVRVNHQKTVIVSWE